MLKNKEKSIFGARVFNQFLFFCPALLVLIFNLTFFNRYFPLSEGWWETYGYLINKGLVPYKDFNLAFPPLVPLVNAFLLKYVSGNFFVLRLIGVFLFSLIPLILQRCLEFLFDRRLSAIVILFATFLMISNIVFIAKDYHTYVLIFVALTLLLGQEILSLKGRVNNFQAESAAVLWIKISCCLLLLGFFIGLTALTKQNIGLFLFIAYVFCILLLPTDFLSFSSKITWLIFYGIGVIVVFFSLGLYFHLKGIPFVTIGNLFINDNSKGSGFVVLTRIVTNRDNWHLLLGSFFMLFFYALFLTFMNSVRNAMSLKETHLKMIFSTSLLLAAFVGGLGLYGFRNHFHITGLTIMISLSALEFLFFKVYFFKNKSPQNLAYHFLVIPLIALAYCDTQTATFGGEGTFFVVAVAFAYLLNASGCIPYLNRKYLMIGLLVVVPWVVVQKCQHPYSWWGLSQSPIYSAKNELSNVYMRGIYMDDPTAEAFNIIGDSINKFSKTNSDVYLFPDIPIFYYLYHKVPPYKNVVQWFDVITSADLQDEFNSFNQKLPAVIVFLDPPDYVYAGHAALIKRPLIQLMFKKKFEELVQDGSYRLYQSFIYDAVLDHIYYDDHVQTRNVILKNRNLNGKTLSYLYMNNQDEMMNNILIKGVIHNGISEPISGDTVIYDGDTLILEITDSDLTKVVNNLGYLSNSDFYTIKIYVKNS
ncbi:MAG: hypothetical protein A2103_00500 [Gammaproteobacteria bacterium GWF2_41_13]|nr:MAG: hypothetical protein A2103_00500 [Gammaproteobacteria bacterium GWF2_41_13]